MIVSSQLPGKMLLFSLTDPVLFFFTPSHCNRKHLGNLIWPFSESQVLYSPGTGEEGCVLLMEVVDQGPIH